MDKRILSRFPSLNVTAKSMIKAFGKRERNIEMMDVRRLKYEMISEGLEFVPEEFIPNFKTLEKAGVGKLVQEKGQPLRWRWTRPLKDVVAAAQDSMPPVIQQSRRVSNLARNEATELLIMLGPSREAVINIPSDLSAHEVDFMCKALQSKVRR